METMCKIPNVAIYCRLSKDDGTVGDSASISSQKQILIDFCNKNNFIIYDIFVDDGYSGTNFDRPSFIKMLKAIENKKIDIVLTKDLSRLGRNYIKTGYYTDEYFPNHKVRYIALNDGYDTTSENDNANDIAPFKNVINEWYARDVSKKIRSVLKMKNQMGEIKVTSLPLYGYKYSDDGKSIQLNEETCGIVEKIFNLFSHGKTSIDISKILANEKVYSPMYYNFLKTGYNCKKYNECLEEEKYKWHPASILKMIKNKEYLGTYITNKSSSISFKNHKKIYNPTNQQYQFNDARPQIISKDLFDSANRNITNRVNQISKKTIEEKPLYGILFCKECGKNLNLGHTKKRNGSLSVFYSCQHNGCNEHAYILKSDIEEIVITYTKKIEKIIIENETQIIEYAKNYVKPKKPITINSTNKLEELKSKFEVLKTKIIKLTNNNLNGLITDDIYALMSKPILEQKKLVEEQIIELTEIENNEKVNIPINYVEDVKDFINIIKEHQGCEILDHDYLKSIYKKIFIGRKCIDPFYPRKKVITIDVHLNIADRLLENFLNIDCESNENKSVFAMEEIKKSILNIIQENNTVSMMEISKEIGITLYQVRKIIEEMKKENILLYIRRYKGRGEWILKKNN